MTRTPPTPLRHRWQPLRAGLVDLFYYDAEEFWFRDGRLLLRGNNGAGKSKVLALTLPFLLDGDLAAHRVEPDADPKKRMEWNLLLGGAHPHPERIGYTWLEFGRLGADGTAHYLTIGCGLKAVTGKGIAAHWFFVSPERVGDGLHLVDRNGTPLTRDRLGDELGATGRRFDRAGEYRSAVDEALFGLGQQRYAALIDLLIRLRQPQLSKRPSEKALSAALTESLPPLGQAVLADVAEAFRSLQEDREELAAMSEAFGAATTFLTHYRSYARLACRRQAAKPRVAHSRYEQLGRDLADAERRVLDADSRRAAVAATLGEVERESDRLTAHEEALRSSTAMEAATQLDSARKTATLLAQQAQRAADDRDIAAEAAADRQERFEAAVAALDAAREAASLARNAASTASDGAALSDRHAADVDAALGTIEIAELRRVVAALVATQQAAVRRVETLVTEVERRGRDLTAARARFAELDARAAEPADARAAAGTRVADATVVLSRETREHLSAATELRLTDPHDVFEELRAWCESLAGDNPYTVAVADLAAEVRDGVARTDAAEEAAAAALRAELDQLETEQDRLESGHVDAPPPRYTVDPERAGTPLWRLVDFTRKARMKDRAGLEAALEASGALDARVSADGALVGSDLVVTAGDPAPGRSLADVLTPAIDPDDPEAVAVGADTVAAVLAAVGLGPGHHTWVDTDGRFRVGALTGAWRKDAAQYIGAGAREQARRRRLAELAEAIAAVDGQIAEVAERRTVLAERRATVTLEHKSEAKRS
ncbi:hypothetical protein GCM10023147_01170 [Tsukamurella soli]|uniref:TIGR02680 family protein n=1 Tax=Tsukamurella soli TaxID=644556 RepID=A0ABP8J0R2_9ACTN